MYKQNLNYNQYQQKFKNWITNIRNNKTQNLINPNQLQQKFKNWIIDLYNIRVQDFINHNQLNSNSNISLAYAITIKYNTNHITKDSFKIINNKFKGIYHKILVLTCGNNTKRNKHIKPQAIMFCDVAGTKYHKANASHENNNAHHHGVIFIHPYQINKWNSQDKINHIKSSLESFSDVQSVDIQDLLTEEDRKEWFDYASKYFRHNINDMRISDKTMVITE